MLNNGSLKYECHPKNKVPTVRKKKNPSLHLKCYCKRYSNISNTTQYNNHDMM